MIVIDGLNAPVTLLFHILGLFRIVIIYIHYKFVKISVSQESTDHGADVISRIDTIGPVRAFGCGAFGVGNDGL